MAQTMRFILDGDDRLSPVLNNAGDSSARLHRRLNDDMNANSRSVAGFTRDANGRLRDLQGRFLSAADSARVLSGGMPDLAGRLGDVSAAGGDAAASLGRSGGGLGGVMGGVAAVAGLSLLPALGALVPMMAGTALAAGTLKLGFAGVGDAMEASGKSKEEYEKALKKLSPEARSFTKELVGMKKEFAGVGKDVQKAMLPGFTQAVKSAGPLVKILGDNMTDLGGTFGNAAKAAGRVFKESGFQRDLQANLTLGKQFVGDMMSGFGGLGRSLLDFGAASKPTLTALSGGIRDVLGKGLPGMFDGLKVGIEGSSKFLTGFFNMINSLLPALGRFSGEVARALGPLFGEMMTSLGVRGAGAMDMLGQGVKALTPVFKDLGFGLKATTDLIRIIGPTVKDTAGAIVGSLLPSFSQVDQARGPLQRLSDAIRNNKGAIQEGARVFGNVMIEMVRGAVNAVPPIIHAWKLVSVGILAAIGVAVGAAAKLWGWVPGIGGKLRAANESFNKFKDGYVGTLNAAEKKANDFAASTNAKLSRNQLKMNISNWNSQIETANAKLKTVPPSKQAALKATIADLQAKVASAKGQLASLPSSRTINVTISHFTKRTTRIITQYQTQYLTGRSQHDITGATGGLYTGTGFKHRGYAKGGLVDGPGTETSDSVFAPWLSKNEFVVNAKRTRQFLPLLKAINEGKLALGSLANSGGGAMAGAGAEAARGLAGGMTGSMRTVEAGARQMAGAVVAGVRGELQISSPSKKTRALAKDVARGFIEGLTGSRDKIKATAKDLSNDIKAAFSGGKERSLLRMLNEVTFKNSYLAKSRDGIAAKIKAAKEYASAVTTNARQGAGLSNLGMGEGEVTAGGIKGGLAAKLTQIRRFAAYVKELAGRGLNKSLLRQILDMGPEQGYAYASALAGAHKSTFTEINSLQKRIDTDSTSLGRIGADRLYDAGKNAGRGFLKGLEGQQKRIEDLMLRIAKAMQKAIKRSLGIRSPSTVMARLGAYSTEGLARGLLDGKPALDKALSAVSGRVAATTPVLGRPAVRAGTGTTVILNVEVRPGANAQQVWQEIRTGLLTLKRTNGGGDLGLA